MKSNSISHNERLRKSSDLLSQYRHFPKPGAGLTKQKHTNRNAMNSISNLIQKQNPGFKTLKSSNSSRHPDGVGADAGHILGMLLIQAF